MKQKRTYVTVLLVVALLALGVAYAALGTQNMTVTTGVATSVDGTMNVKITNVAIPEGKGTASVGDGMSATLNVTGLKKANDSVTTTVTFTNNQEGVPAEISLVDVKKADGSAWVDTEWLRIEASEVTYTEDGDSVATGKTATATITVTLLKTPGTTDDEAKATVSGVKVNYKADAVNQ